MDEQITIQNNAGTTTTTGAAKVSWAALHSDVWSAWFHKSGNERAEAGAIVDFNLWQVVIDYESGITSKNRILRGTDVYNIRSVDTDAGGRERYIVLMAEKDSLN